MSNHEDLSGLGAKADKPRLNPDLDLGNFKLTPTEGFILSRIDGRASYEDICRMSSLGREHTLAILRKLKRSGMIHDSQSQRQFPSGPRTPPPIQVTDEMLRKAQEKDGEKLEDDKAHVPLLERLDDGSAVDTSELADGTDLSDDMKRRLLRLFRRMRKIPPHELLGVASDADSATIKRAFAAASKELHPDRFFGKDLGHFREKLAKIFNRITEAMQELEKTRKPKK